MADVKLRIESSSNQAQSDLKKLREELKNLGDAGKTTSQDIAGVGDGFAEAANSPATQKGTNQLIQLTKDIGTAFRVALYDVPVGLIKETFSIIGNQKPPPFLDDITEQIRTLDTLTESATRPIANLGGILGQLESEIVTTSTATDFFIVRLGLLEPELLRVNNSLARKRREYIELVRLGTDPADTSLRQVTASIEILEGKSLSLTREVGGLQKNLAAADVETRAFQSSTENFGGALSAVDTRFLSFNERITVFQETIRTLPPEIAGVSGEFDVLAATADRVNAVFENLNTSLVDSQTESEILDAVTRKIIQDLQDLDALSHVRAVIAERTDVHNANLVNTAISQATQSFLNYNQVLSDVQDEYESVEEISKSVTTAIRSQATAFDELRQKVDSADISLGDIYDQLDLLGEVTVDTGKGFRDLADVIEQEIEDSKSFVEELDLALENDLTPTTEKVAIAFQRVGTVLSDPNFLGGFLDLLGAANTEISGLTDSLGNLLSAASRGDGIAFLAQIPGLVRSLNDLQTDETLTTEARTSSAFNIIGQIQDSDLSASQQQELISPIQEYIRELLTRSILSAPQALSPALIAQHESFAGTRGLDFNFGESRQALGLGDTGFQTPFELPEIDLSGVISQLAQLARLGESAKQRRGSGEEATETTSGGGTARRSTAQQPNLQALTDVQSAYIQSLGFDPGAYGYDRQRNAFIKTAQGNGPTLLYDDSVAFDEARTAEAPAGSELGTPSATATAPDPRTTFSFTGDERATLAPYLTAVRSAENAIEDLTDNSTPQEIADAYQGLVFAQTNLKNVSEGIIRAAEDAERITGTAATNAIRTLGLDLGDDLRTANNALISTLGDVGFEVVGGIENIREAIDVSDISSAFRRIPEEVEATPDETLADPKPLRNFFRFTEGQGEILTTLSTNVANAERELKRLRDDPNATPQALSAAYTNLTTAEKALFNQQVAFINSATNITTEVRENALKSAQGEFMGEIFDANEDLVEGLANIGSQLTTTIVDWFLILTGTQLAIEAIPDPVAPDDPNATPQLRETFRFTGAQNQRLGILRNTITAAEDAVGLLNEDSTEAEIASAYATLSTAEQALYTQQVGFILNATGITEDARGAALSLAEGRFGREIFDANQKLVSALGNVGLQLITMFDATTGILSGTGLSTQAITEQIRDADPEAERNTRLQATPESDLLENAIARARFNLTGATTEQGFNTAQRGLITAIDAYYDNELARINELDLSETELQNFREDNQLKRDQALRRATTAENHFQSDRLDMEKETQDNIQDLRDDALDAHTDHLDTLENLQARHNNRIFDLELDLFRDLDDLRRDRIFDARDDLLDYQRGVEDLQTRFTRRLFGDAISFSDLTADQQARVTESTGFRQGLFDLGTDSTRERQDRNVEFGGLRPGSAGYNFYRQQLESGELTDTNLIEQLFGREGLQEFTQFGRGVEDADTSLAQGIIDASTDYQLVLSDNTTALENLTSALSTPQSVNQALETYSLPSAAPILASTPGATPATTQPISEMIASGVSQGIQQATSESGDAPVINLNQTFYIQLDDGAIAAVEARLALRSDQGLSILDV